MASLGHGDYRTYRVQRSDRGPLLAFMLDALRSAGCMVIQHTPPTEAPFRIVFNTPSGERIGVVAYAFLANQRLTLNRPADERRFQVKYGPKTEELHEIWQDPSGLYTTVMLGIDPEAGFFVGVDPLMHSPTRFYISIEFKEREAREVLTRGWHAWERQRRVRGLEEPVEVMVGGTTEHFLQYIRFERIASGLDQGNRHLLADNPTWLLTPPAGFDIDAPAVRGDPAHPLAREFELSPDEILDVIASARRLRMAVRGWVAEEKLRQALTPLPGIARCERLDVEGGPDLMVRLVSGPEVAIECKNVLRSRAAGGLPKLDFQRTRASKADPCSRYYASSDFDVVAACLHAVTETWEFRFAPTGILRPHATCSGKLASGIVVDGSWSADAVSVIEAAGLALGR